MADDLDRLADWIVPLLHQLQPAQRRMLAREIARALRADNAQRMRAQVGPDGTPWTPRKAQPAGRSRARRGQLRKPPKSGAMFTKLRQARHFKTSATDAEAAAFFSGMAERIARVHHLGLRDRVKPGGPMYEYPARELLGITPEFNESVRDRILRHLAAGN